MHRKDTVPVMIPKMAPPCKAAVESSTVGYSDSSTTGGSTNRAMSETEDMCSVNVSLPTTKSTVRFVVSGGWTPLLDGKEKSY